MEMNQNEAWKSKLEFGRNKMGLEYLLKNGRNAQVILENCLGNQIAFDSFKNADVICGDLPWREREFNQRKYEAWQGSDDKRLLHWLDCEWNLNGSPMIQNALTEVLKKRSFHPVKEFIEGVTWDGVSRVENFFSDYLGAEETEYVRKVTRLWFAAAVARIYEPGCKFDEMIVLVGGQGIGKSWTIAKLAGEWFSDSLKNLDNKEAGEHLQGAWIIEFGEMAGMKKSEVEEIKAFLSKTSDAYRVAYDRVVTDFPRKCVFIGTTNDPSFLRDQTGNRRFYPIVVDKSKRKHNPFEALSQEIVHQIWAEALVIYKNGEPLFLDTTIKRFAEEIQKEHTLSDPREGLIDMFLEMPLPKKWKELKPYERHNWFKKYQSATEKQNIVGNREKVSAIEIWCECFGNKQQDFNSWNGREIAEMIRIQGWKERRPSRTRFIHYGTQTTFTKV